MTDPASKQKLLQEETAFADSQYARMLGDTRINSIVLKKYGCPRHMWDWRERAGKLLGDVQGKTLLDYGCGHGRDAAVFAVLGAKVTAIDISAVGIQVGRQRASAHRLDIDFHVMSCVPTQFPGGSFDIVFGSGILHHVGLREGLSEVYRLLAPGGVAVFLEPFGSSRVVETTKLRLHATLGRRRRLTPVTSGEENLKLKDVRRETAHWAYRRIYPYHLTYRARKLLLPKMLWNWSRRTDYALLTVLPPLQHFAGAALIHVSK